MFVRRGGDAVFRVMNNQKERAFPARIFLACDFRNGYNGLKEKYKRNTYAAKEKNECHIGGGAA